MVLQFLQIADCILSGALKLQLRQGCGLIFRRHVSQHHLADGGTVERNCSTDARIYAQRLRGVQFFDVHRAEIVAKREMDGLTRSLIYLLQIRKTEAADVEMRESRLTQGKAGDPKMECAVAGGIQKST